MVSTAPDIARPLAWLLLKKSPLPHSTRAVNAAVHRPSGLSLSRSGADCTCGVQALTPPSPAACLDVLALQSFTLEQRESTFAFVVCVVPPHLERTSADLVDRQGCAYLPEMQQAEGAR